MEDRFKREIDYLRISVTDRCNLRCFYCMPEEGVVKKAHANILRDEEILEAARAAVKLGLKKIRITGGEPLVRKGIYELIEKIHAIEGIREITLTTNGTLLRGNVKKLKAAGVKRVNLSLDTMDADTYRAITRTPEPIDYHGIIQELIDEGMQPVKVNAVLLRGINDHEIEDFMDLADRYDITVRFIELMPIGHLPYDYKRHLITKDEILQRHPELKLETKERVAENYAIPGKRGRIGFIDPISHKFCSRCNRLRLTADGKLKPCLHSNEEIDIKDLTPTELLHTFKKAIHHKPASHAVNPNTQIDRSMNKIGG
ncbi:MAG: GTP 3',8-cyclase MoaA [Bacillota bacterium]